MDLGSAEQRAELGLLGRFSVACKGPAPFAPLVKVALLFVTTFLAKVVIVPSVFSSLPFVLSFPLSFASGSLLSLYALRHVD